MAAGATPSDLLCALGKATPRQLCISAMERSEMKTIRHRRGQLQHLDNSCGVSGTARARKVFTAIPKMAPSP